MINIKAFIKILVVAILIIGMLAGCGEKPSPSPSPNSTPSLPEEGTVKLQDNAIYKIVSALSGRVIQTQNFSKTNGSNLEQDGYRGDTNQLWRAVLQSDGSYCFVSIGMEQRYMTLKKGEKDNNTLICVNIPNENDDSQKWKVYEVNETYNRIVSVKTGKPIEVQKANKSVGAKIVQNDFSDESNSQYWRIEKVDDGERELPQMFPITGAVEHSSCPEVVKCGDLYYMYIMSPGIAIKTSKDLRNWETLGKVFPVKGSKLPFDWMEERVPGGGIWAPGVYKIGDIYYLYYCVSTSGSQNSFIAVATNTTLDHTSPDFKWVDKGIVISSELGDPYNCIDPNVFIDDNGQAWLLFGSYWSGIQVRKLNNATGKLAADDTTIHNIAGRPGTTTRAIEAPYMIKRGDYYYLFAAMGNLNEDYHCEVARSESMFGPFLDRKNRPMLFTGNDANQAGGTRVSESKPGLNAPGHASIFLDDDGKYYFITEYLEKGFPSQLAISTIVWDEEGWPQTALTPGLFPVE